MATSLLPSKMQTSEFSSFNEIDSNSMNSIASSNSMQITETLQNGENQNGSQTHAAEAPQTIKVEIPKISTRDLQPQRPQSPFEEQSEQYGFLFNGLGAKRDPTKISSKYRTPELEECLKKAKKFALEQSVRYVLVKQQQQQQKQQLELIKKQQALLLMCRIYVGSIFYEVKEESVRTTFGHFGPIRSISMSWDAATNKHKGFAFIEFETPEAAQLSLEQMNGVLMGGRNIKVGRPSNMPQAQPIIDQLTEEAKNYNRIYISSIHPDLTEQDVQSVFEAFGNIKSSSLVRDPTTGKHKGFGFIEYDTNQAAQDAINSMNLFDLGGQLLRVGKAVTPPEGTLTSAPTPQMPTASAIAAASITAQIQVQEAENSGGVVTSSVIQQSIASVINSAPLPVQSVPTPSVAAATASASAAQSSTITQSASQQQLASQAAADGKELTENQKTLLGMTSADDPTASLEQQVELTLRGKEQRYMLMQKLMARKPESKVIILRNMVGPEDVDEDLENEITEECGKYGEVEQVVIYNEKQGEEEDAEVIVKIFVEFANTQAAAKAMNALHGRYFAGRIVKAEVYDQSAYLAKDYSG